MRDGPFLRFWHRRSEEVVHLTRRRAGVVLAWETSPICKQDRYTDARGVSRTAIPREEGLSCASARRTSECGDNVMRDRKHVRKRSVVGGTQRRRRGKGNGGCEDGEGGSGELQESLCSRTIFPTGDKKFRSSVQI